MLAISMKSYKVPHFCVLHGSERVVPLGASHALPVPAGPVLMAYFSLRTPPPQLLEQLDAPTTFHLALQSTAAAGGVVVAKVGNINMYTIFSGRKKCQFVLKKRKQKTSRMPVC